MISLKLKISGGRASLVYEYIILVYRSVVSKGQKLFPACIPTVPDTEGCGRLVREHHVVLCLVEHGLSLVLLQTHQASDSSSFSIDLLTCLPVEPAPV